MLNGSNLREWKEKDPESVTDEIWCMITEELAKEDSKIMDKYRNFLSVTTEAKRKNTQEQLAKWVTKIIILQMYAF